MVCLSEKSLRSLDYVVSWTKSIREPKCHIHFNYEVSCKQRNGSPKMTLIATVWSPEGFAIAADGIQVYEDHANSETRIEDVQKIFSTAFVNNTGFAWAWVGHTAAEFASGRHYDLKEITKRVMAELPDEDLDDPQSYFEKIALRIFYELEPPNSIPSSLPDGDDDVIFVGYLAGKPLWTEITFQRRDGMYLPPVTIEPKIEPRNFNAFAGSKTICKQMKDTGKLSQPLYLSEAISEVHKYAKTCVESKESVPDCKYFGETVHVATVTKSGFSWIIEPNKG